MIEDFDSSRTAWDWLGYHDLALLPTAIQKVMSQYGITNWANGHLYMGNELVICLLC